MTRQCQKGASKSQAVAFLFKEKAGKKPKSQKTASQKAQKGKQKSSRQPHKSRPTKSQLHTQKAEPRKK